MPSHLPFKSPRAAPGMGSTPEERPTPLRSRPHSYLSEPRRKCRLPACGRPTPALSIVLKSLALFDFYSSKKYNDINTEITVYSYTTISGNYFISLWMRKDKKMAKESFNFLEYFNEPKEFIKTKPVSFPEQNQAVSLKGKGSLTKAAYIMNINRKRCIFKRITYQNRLEKTSIILARLDIDTKPHRNPDGSLIGGTHLHLYQEGFGDRWAFALDDVALIRKILPTYQPIQVIDEEFMENFQRFAVFCGFVNFPRLDPILQMPHP